MKTQLEQQQGAAAEARAEARAAGDKMEALQQAKYTATEKLAVLQAEYATFKALAQQPAEVAEQLREVLEVHLCMYVCVCVFIYA